MDRKGLEVPFGGVIAGLFALMAVVIIYLLFFAKVQDVHVIVVEAEAEMHAISLAQILLSSDKLVYTSDKVYRGVFDKSKLDVLDDLDIWYPDAVAVIGIEDLETSEQWSTTLSPKIIGGTTAVGFFNCLKDTLKIDITMIFRIPTNSPWEWPDLWKCTQEDIANQLTPSVREYPVAIRISNNEIHTGKMKVSLVELTF